MTNAANDKVANSLNSLRSQIIKLGGRRFGDELFSDVCYKALRGNYSHPGSIILIARSCLIDLRRKENVRRHLSIGTVPDPADSYDDPQREFEKMEQEEEVRRAVMQLDPKDSEVIDLFYFKPRNLQQISQQLNRPAATVRSQKKRVIEKLRVCLNQLH